MEKIAAAIVCLGMLFVGAALTVLGVEQSPTDGGHYMVIMGLVLVLFGFVIGCRVSGIYFFGSPEASSQALPRLD